MPYKISWEERGVYIKWFGIITAEENIRLNGEIYGNKLFETIEYQIGDFIDAEHATFTEREIYVIAKLEIQASRWNKRLMVAHITKDPEIVKAIKSYEYNLRESDWKFGIFDDLEDARKWVKA